MSGWTDNEEMAVVTANESNEKVAVDSLENLEVRFIEPGDIKAICGLFKKIFNEDMSEAHWHWKYDKDQSRAVVVYRGDDLLAHYGGVGTDILLEGKQSTAMQITDLMVDPAVRHGVRARSPFYLAAEKFLHNTVGFEKPFLLSYGFPSERAMGLSEKLGFFNPVGQMWEAEWEIEKSADRKITVKENQIVELTAENYRQYEKGIDSLWNKFSKLFEEKIICKKDAEYFKWRFLEHPTKNYALYLVNGGWFRGPQALLVLRHDDDQSMLMDILGNSFELQTLIRCARNISEAKNSHKMISWCSDTFKDVFDLDKAKMTLLPIIIPACSAAFGPAPETQKNKWWFMPGDTDYL
ncbi:MAG: GNAT family N-acetyltransferase [Gammaproteobacteria bacterium]|nr:GNAT family N-acetyltransferase [Gammaproteobacteria bacterium]